MSFSRFERTPVNLSHNDGIGLHHRHLRLKLAAHALLVGLIIITRTRVIPTGITVYGIAEVVLGVNDWILGIIVIPRLPSRTGHPDYTLESIFTDNVNYRLEIITKCHRTVLAAFAVIYVNRFVGKLDAHFASIIIKVISD